MKDNTYRIILGAILLAALYLDVEIIIYGVIAVTLLEGITNWRIPKLVNQALKKDGLSQSNAGARFNIEAERMFRLMVGLVLVATFPFGSDSILWFFPWFMSIVFLGAGFSGLCPAILLLKGLGFR